MHENFLSYMMIGLSRGLFPSQPQPNGRFDEEVFLLRQAAAARREAREKGEKREKAEEPHPIATGRVVTWRRRAKADDRASHPTQGNCIWPNFGRSASK